MNSTGRNYTLGNQSIVSILVYPDPIPLVCARIAVATIIDKARNNQAYLEACTPGYDNNEGKPYLANAQAIGFQLMPWAEVGTAGLQPGDVILMRVAAKQTNHAAIYMGGGNILHHLWGHLSALELFDGRFQRFTTHIGRHRGLPPC
jgi:cell wall-associated NlpC family hydrolase